MFGVKIIRIIQSGNARILITQYQSVISVRITNRKIYYKVHMFQIATCFTE